MDRESTNSMTKLTKVIALEVNKPRFERLEKHIKQLEADAQFFRIQNTDAKELVRSVQSSLEKAGDPWFHTEDSLLVDEVKMAIAQIAKNHNRSYGAIKARINHKDLI